MGTVMALTGKGETRNVPTETAGFTGKSVASPRNCQGPHGRKDCGNKDTALGHL